MAKRESSTFGKLQGIESVIVSGVVLVNLVCSSSDETEKLLGSKESI